MTKEREYLKGLFYPLKGGAGNNFEVYGFDVETIHSRKDFKRKTGKDVHCWEQDFFMGSVVGENVSKVFYDRNEMGDYLLARKFMGCQVFATNLEFDFNMLYYDRLDEFKLIYNHGLLAAIYSDRKNDKNRKWTFNESMNFMRCGVEKLGKIVGLKKLPKPATMEEGRDGIEIISRKPRNDDERKELEEYNLNDSRITYLFAKHQKEFCTDHNMKLKLTIGSTGMDYWRRNHQKVPLRREPKDLVMKHFQGSFRGGMTQVFKRGMYAGKLWYYDYRSSYPAAMVRGVDGKGNYPDPSSYKHTEKASSEIIECYDGICNAEVKAPYDYVPYLGVRTADGKLIFGHGNFSGWFTNYELRRAMKYGYEVSPGEAIYYTSMAKPFSDAVKYLYKLRKKYKEEGSAYESMVKVLMNSGLFGKWGTNPNNMEEIVSLKNIEFRNGMAFHNGKQLDGFRVNEVKDMFNGFVSVKKAAKPFKYSFPIWSEYTTALGRDKLITDIKSKRKDLVYCDTDSAIMTRPVFESGSELGDWNLEHDDLVGGLFIKPKLYMLYKNGELPICRSKGIGRFMNSKEKFLGALDAGSVSMERFTKMKESNALGIRSGSVVVLNKMIGLEDNKRDWLGKRFSINDWQNSEPLKLLDGVPEPVHAANLRRAFDAYEKERREERVEALERTDFFDSMGADITKEEFLRNEMDVDE